MASLITNNFNLNAISETTIVSLAAFILIAFILFGCYKIYSLGNTLKKINNEQAAKIESLERELAVTRESYNRVVSDLSNQINLNNLLRENLQYFFNRHLNNNDTTNN